MPEVKTRFQLTIDCDTPAFEEPNEEVARILGEAAKELLGDLQLGQGWKLQDRDGTVVGSWCFVTEGGKYA